MKHVQKKNKQNKSKCNDEEKIPLNKNALLKLDKTTLIKRLKSHKLSTKGTKNELAGRLYKHLTNNKKKKRKMKKKKVHSKYIEPKNDNDDIIQDSVTDSCSDAYGCPTDSCSDGCPTDSCSDGCPTDSCSESSIDLTFTEDDEIIFGSYEGYKEYMNNFTNVDMNKSGEYLISGYAKEIFNDTNEYIPIIPSVIIQSIYKYYHIHPRYIMYQMNIESCEYNDVGDLLESFLDLVNPQVNWKMVEFLSKDYISGFLLSFLSVPKNNMILNWPKNKLYDKSEITLDENLNELECSNERNWSRSLAKLLMNNDGQETIASFQLRKMYEIIFHGLCAYYPETGGYRTYGRNVLVKCYKKWPKSFLGVICGSNNDIQCLLHGILYNDMIHYNTIDSLFKYIICMKFEDSGLQIMRNKFIEQLKAIDIEGMKECVDTIIGESELYVNPPDCNI